LSKAGFAEEFGQEQLHAVIEGGHESKKRRMLGLVLLFVLLLLPALALQWPTMCHDDDEGTAYSSRLCQIREKQLRRRLV
jgi:hypothetical protein